MFKTAASAVGLHALIKEWYSRLDLNQQPSVFETDASCRIGLREPTDFGFWILDFGLDSGNRFNFLPNRKSKIKNRKSIWWTERDSNPYEKFAAAFMLSVTSSARKSGVEDGTFTRTSHVLTKLCTRALRVFFRFATST